MKRASPLFLSLAAWLIASAASAADSTSTGSGAPEGRFDAQVFRPLAAPRDLVMVPKSEVIGHLSPVAGVYWDAAFNPLTLAIGDSGKTLNAIGARLQITPVLGIGLFDWVELTMAIPFVAWQTSDNLRSIGTEGEIQSTPGIGDVRVSTKIAVPYFNRKDEVKSGFGLALGADINLPSGDELAFTSDGALSGGAQIIADYRFNFGLLLASNLGVWLRPEHQFAGVKIGDMAQFGVAAEMYVVQRWGLSVIGELYGYPSLTKYPEDKTQVPAEALLGVRWQTRQGITVTLGGSFGAACGFGAPAFRLWNSVTWQPKSSVEQREINRLLERDSADPDHDGLIESADKCPTLPGRPENLGCPDTDRDKDGIADVDDKCPDEPSGEFGKDGCPMARVDGDTIALLGPIDFEKNSDVILDTSWSVLQGLRRTLIDNPEIRKVRIEGHTDIQGSDHEGVMLSLARMKAVMYWLAERGIERERLVAKSWGHWMPLVDDSWCLAPEERLSANCKNRMKTNRRIVVTIRRRGPPPPFAILAGDPSTAPILPMKPGPPRVIEPFFKLCRAFNAKDKPAIDCVLPMTKKVLTTTTVLQRVEESGARLPAATENTLPSSGALLPSSKDPSSGAPR